MVLDSLEENRLQKHAWWILFILEILLLLNILFVIMTAEGPDDFFADTGVSWAEFSQTYPSVAKAFRLDQGIALTAYLGMVLFALFVTFFAFRQGLRWAWFALWIFPTTLVLTTLLFMLFDQLDLGAYYGIFASIVVLVLLLPIRRFFPGK